MAISFRLNGKPTTVDVPPEMPVLWVLRDVLDMKGTKFGCGGTFCGACTVHVNGAARPSCRLPVSEVQGAEITTIEGLSADGSHPVQVAWREIDVPQCGYCQAGQIMAVSALLAENPKPSDTQIDRALQRNLCRCGTYTRIRQAVHRAAELTASGAASTSAGPAAAGNAR
jgi:aerobic-type carbon monoxide dehydrogenase small subunit (CoxS/CutS family)